MEDNFDPEQYELEFVDIHTQCAQKDYATIYEEAKQLLLDGNFDDYSPEVKGRAELLAKRLQEDHTVDTLFQRIGETDRRSVELHLDALILQELGRRVDQEAYRSVARKLWTESEATLLRRLGFVPSQEYDEMSWEFEGGIRALLRVSRDSTTQATSLYISGLSGPLPLEGEGALEGIPALVLSQSRSCVFTSDFQRTLPILRTFFQHVGMWEQAQQEFQDAFSEALLTED
jgi:hypothetical protein